MQCIYLNADGTLTATSETPEQCTGYVLVSAADAQAFSVSTQINALDITEAFTWGFGSIFLLAFLSYKVKVGLRVIKLV